MSNLYTTAKVGHKMGQAVKRKIQERRKNMGTMTSGSCAPPSLVIDRQAKGLTLLNISIAPIIVDDPYALNPGDKIEVSRNLRDDPLGRLHDRKQIDEAQYHGGRAFQRDWEIAERGPRAIDPSKEFVDGGRAPEPITDGQMDAADRLIAVEAVLGPPMSKVAHSVLIRGLNCELVALENGRYGRRWEEYYASQVQVILHILAVEYDFAMRPKTPIC